MDKVIKDLIQNTQTIKALRLVLKELHDQRTLIKSCINKDYVPDQYKTFQKLIDIRNAYRKITQTIPSSPFNEALDEAEKIRFVAEEMYFTMSKAEFVETFTVLAETGSSYGSVLMLSDDFSFNTWSTGYNYVIILESVSDTIYYNHHKQKLYDALCSDPEILTSIKMHLMAKRIQKSIREFLFRPTYSSGRIGFHARSGYELAQQALSNFE